MELHNKVFWQLASFIQYHIYKILSYFNRQQYFIFISAVYYQNVYVEQNDETGEFVLNTHLHLLFNHMWLFCFHFHSQKLSIFLPSPHQPLNLLQYPETCFLALLRSQMLALKKIFLIVFFHLGFFALISFFFFLARPCGTQDLSSPTRDLLNQNPLQWKCRVSLAGSPGSPLDGQLYHVKQSTMYIEQIYF